MPAALKILDPLILEPLPGAPAGTDLSNTQEGLDLENLCRKLRGGAADGNESWRDVQERAHDALAAKTKDLRIVRTLLEALVHTQGFDGVHDGLLVTTRFLNDFWDTGLFPLIEDGDREYRGVSLNWYDQKLGEELKALPLTAGDPGLTRFDFEHAQSGNDPDFPISRFTAAMDATETGDLQVTDAALAECLERLVELNQLTMQKFGPEAFSYGRSLEALRDCKKLVELSLGQRQTKDPGTNDGSTGAPTGGAGAITGLFSMGDATAGSWSKAEELIKGGQVEQGVREMARLAATEPNGRARFFRKLLLADVCLRTKRDRLAVKILEELSEQINTYKLAEWETSEVVGAVWTRLYRLYSKVGTETENSSSAAALYDKLTRLDPWQAMNL